MGDLAQLRDHLRSLDRVVVAFSGGADSALLAWVAHDTLGPRAGAGRHRGVAVARRPPSTPTAPRWPTSGACAWTEVLTDEMRDGGLPAQRRRPVLLVQGRADGRGRTARSPADGEHAGATVVLGVNLDDLGDHRPGQSAAAAAGRGVPARRRRVHQGRRAPVLARARPAHLGQAGGGVPRVPGAVRFARDRRRPQPRRAGRGGPPRPRVPRRSACATTTTPLASRCRSPTSIGSSSCGRRSWPPCAGPGYRYVTLDLEGLRSGNLNAALDALDRIGPMTDPGHRRSAGRRYVPGRRCAAISRGHSIGEPTDPRPRRRSRRRPRSRS